MTTIIFNDGTTLEVEQNGSTFIADTKPAFPSDLTNIEIEETYDVSKIVENDGEEETVTETVTRNYSISNGLVVKCYAPDNKYYFAIIEKPYQMVLEERLSEQDDIICELLEML